MSWLNTKIVTVFALVVLGASCDAKLSVQVADSGKRGVDPASNKSVYTPVSSVSNIACTPGSSSDLQVSFAAADQIVSESVGKVSVAVNLSQKQATNTTVAYSVSGTATNPSDHNLANGSVIIPACQLSGTIDIDVIDDATPEWSETIAITLNPTSPVTSAAPSTHTVTVTNNDALVQNKVNHTLTTSAPRVTYATFTPDQSRVVYTVNSSEGTELYSANHDWTNAVRLSPTSYVTNGSATAVTIAPNSSKVVFLSNLGMYGKSALYSVNLDGTALTQLTPFREHSVTVTQMKFTPDSSRLLVVANIDNNSYKELYSVRLDGTNYIKLNGAISAGSGIDCPANVCHFVISNDSASVAFSQTTATAARNDLFVAPVGGGTPLLLSNRAISAPSFAGSSNAIVFTSDRDTTNLAELFAIQSNGTGLTKLNGTLVTGGGVSTFAIPPSGAKVYFAASPTTAAHKVMQRVNLDGTSLTAFSDDATASTISFSKLAFLPDESYIYFVTSQSGTGQEIWRASTSGTTTTALSPALPANYEIRNYSPLGDGTRIVYSTYYNNIPALSSLRLMDLDGANHKILRSATAPLYMWYPTLVSDDSRYFVIDGALFAASTPSLGWLDSTQAGSPVTLNTMVPAGCSHGNLTPIKRGTTVYNQYLCGGSYQLHAHTFGQAGSSVVNITPNLITKDDVDEIQTNPELTRIIYWAGSNSDRNSRIYASNFDGSANVVLSRTPNVASQYTGIAAFAVIPKLGTNRLIYIGDGLDTDGAYELYSVNLDGTGELKLHSNGSWGLDLGIYGISTTQNRIVFSPDTNTLCGSDICSVNYLDGSGMLSIDTVNTTDSGDYLSGYKKQNYSSTSLSDFDAASNLVPSGTIVYTRYNASKYELYKSSITANAPVALLNSFPVGATGVLSPSVTASGTSVVYIADATTATVNELYVMPIAGGAATKLNGALAASTNVTAFKVSSDSSKVLFQTFTTGNSYGELFVVNINGTGLAKIDNISVTLEVDFTPDSQKIVYPSVPDGSGVVNLFAYHIATTTKSQLSQSTTTKSPTKYSIMPDSQHIVYYGKLATDANELWAIDVNGANRQKITSNVLPGIGTFDTFINTSNGQRIYYSQADATSGVFKIYSYDLSNNIRSVVHDSGNDPAKFARNLVLTPDGANLLVTASYGTEGVFDLYKITLPN